jgi:hypothetical protein
MMEMSLPRDISTLRIYVFSIFLLQALLLIFEEPSRIAFHGDLKGRQTSCSPTRNSGFRFQRKWEDSDTFAFEKPLGNSLK